MAKKKNLFNNPEHIERTILRPTTERFCEEFSIKQNMATYEIVSTEYKKSNIGEAKITFYDQEGNKTYIILDISINNKSSPKITRKNQKRKGPDSFNSDSSE